MLISFKTDAAKGQSFPITDGNKSFDYARYVLFEDSVEFLDDAEFIRASQQVIFKVNKYGVNESSPLLTVLRNEVIPVVNSQGLQLVKMQVRGAASPEGPYQNNVMLAKRRAQFLFDYVNSRLTYPTTDKSSDIYSTPEDYGYLLTLMKEANDPYYAQVEKFIKENLPAEGKNTDAFKVKFKKLSGGKVWLHIYKTYFPKLRSARVVFYFKKAPEVVEKEKKDTVEVKKDTVEVEKDTVMILPPPPVLADTLEEKIDTNVYVPVVSVDTTAYTVKAYRRELLSVKSNLLFDFAWVPGYDDWCPLPNVAIEYYPLHGHFTYGASFDCPWWQHYWEHKYFQVRNYQIDTRYYFRSGDIDKNPPGEGAAFRGTYINAYINAGLYDVCFNERKGWEGEGFGAGLGVGYVLPLTKQGHWRLEFGAQFGFFYTKYDPYQWECPVDPTEQDHLYYYKWTGKAADFKRRQYRFTWFGPTRVGITLSYDLLYRRLAKKGASFRSYEYIQKKGGEL